jgi:lipid-A-disaccharide synthase
MRIFLCAGEPSGDLHAANLIQALRRHHPTIECVGFGGERMEAAGAQLLYPLCQLAVMWFARVLAQAPLFLDLLSRADRYFRHHRPDAVVLIDYPGFNWWLARRAHFHGIPVFYFVPPQLWGWAGWRVEKMRRWVDHVLCTLPFEEAWYHQRGVPTHYVGHPYFDELAEQQLDSAFLKRHETDSRPIIGLLPGSRDQEIKRNLSSLIRAAAGIHAARPDARFLVACFKATHQQQIDGYVRGRDLPLETFVGRTPEIIELSHACLAVSGSVGLELLYRRKPTVVLYRIGRIDLKVCNFFKTSRFISLVNLLAEEELFPEFLTDHCPAAAMSAHILRWLNDEAAYTERCSALAALRQHVAQPGACERAARYVLEHIHAAHRPAQQRAG